MRFGMEVGEASTCECGLREGRTRRRERVRKREGDMLSVLLLSLVRARASGWEVSCERERKPVLLGLVQR